MARSRGIDPGFAKDLGEEVARIDRLLELNREERRKYGIILNTEQLKATKAYLEREIEASEGKAAPAKGN